MRQHMQIKTVATKRSYRHEEFFTTLQSAQQRAAARSLSTNKTVYLVEMKGEWMVNTHGVELVGNKIVERYLKGKKL